MTHVRRHQRETASGKTTTVRAHERDTGDGTREAPGWVQPARPEDFERGPIAPTVWEDEDAEPAGDWWGDGEEVQPVAPVWPKPEGWDSAPHYVDKPTLKGDVETWIKTLAQNDAEYGRDSKDNPNNQSSMSPAFRAMVAQNPSLGGEKFERLRHLREDLGYRGPIDQDGNPADKDEYEARVQAQRKLDDARQLQRDRDAEHAAGHKDDDLLRHLRERGHGALADRIEAEDER